MSAETGGASGPAAARAGSLALLTDLYELTMAQGYWKAGRHEERAVFEMSFRALPFGGGFAVACGLAPLADLVERFRFEDEDLAYLTSLRDAGGRPLLDPAFLDHLKGVRFTGDLDAVPEGTAAFPLEPLVRVEAPVLEGQLLETAVLNAVNFPTLVATKAARVRLAAGRDVVMEFGLRRAQGMDGGVSASRAAYVGGCDATSNLLAGKLFGIPVRGTHAHSFVMFFDDERAAFDAFAEAQPGNCVFLVDTYDTVQGVRNAVEAGRRLRARGFEMAGVRLDSGDLAPLAREARRILDEAGFPGAVIVGSNELDERSLAALKARGAPIGAWGVGTRLATAYDEPALGGVYKLTAVRRPGGALEPRLKISEDPAKTSFPGAHQVRRYLRGEAFAADVIYDAGRDLSGGCAAVEPAGRRERLEMSGRLASEDLLVPVFRAGARVAALPDVHAARARAADQVARLPEGVKRLDRPEWYPVAIEACLHGTRERLAARQRRRIAGGRGAGRRRGA